MVNRRNLQICTEFLKDFQLVWCNWETRLVRLYYRVVWGPPPLFLFIFATYLIKGASSAYSNLTNTASGSVVLYWKQIAFLKGKWLLFLLVFSGFSKQSCLLKHPRNHHGIKASPGMAVAKFLLFVLPGTTPLKWKYEHS